MKITAKCQDPELHEVRPCDCPGVLFISDRMRLDFLANHAWRLSYDEIKHRGFKWRVHLLESMSKPSRNIRTAIDDAIHASRRPRKTDKNKRG